MTCSPQCWEARGAIVERAARQSVSQMSRYYEGVPWWRLEDAVDAGYVAGVEALLDGCSHDVVTWRVFRRVRDDLRHRLVRRREHERTVTLSESLACAPKMVADPVHIPLECLTEYQRRVIEGHYFGGIPLKDMETAGGVSKSAVSHAHRLALRKLRRMMEVGR